MELKCIKKLENDLVGGLVDVMMVARTPEHSAIVARHPERFNEDWTPRLIRIYDSEKNGPMKGTFDEGTHTDKDSRQVRRRKMTVFLFNHISRDPVFGKLPRAARRFWSRNKNVRQNLERHDASIPKPTV